MKIVSAEFLTAAEDRNAYPAGDLREIAFAGRSNVGKSSLINALLGRHNLVRTSKTPGRTRKLNFFLINRGFIFVDLPGYGFANVPLEVKKRWGPMVETYLRSRDQLAGVVIVVDVRLPLTESDRRMIDRVVSFQRFPIVVATKADKLPYNRLIQQQRRFGEELGPSIPLFIFSSHKGQGKNELWNAIKILIQ